MSKVHRFVGPDRGPDTEALLEFLHLSLTPAEGASVCPSAFGREVGLTAANYDAGGIIGYALSTVTQTVRELAADHPVSASWPCASRLAHGVILVYQPNLLAHPERGSLDYLGEFDSRLSTAEPRVAFDGGAAPAILG